MIQRMKLYFRKTYFPFFLVLTLAFAPCFKLLAQETEIKKDTVILNYPAKIIPISDDELDEELDLDEDEIIISEQDSIPNDSTIVIVNDSITVAGDSLDIIANDSIVNIPEKPVYVIPIDFVPDMELVKKITSLPVYPFITYPDTVIFNSLAMPFIYWEDRISTVVPLPKSPLNDDFSLYKQFFKDKLFEDRNHKYNIQRDAYFYILDNHLVNYQYTKSQFKGEIEEEKQLETTIFDNLFKIEIDLEKDKAKPEKFQQKRKYWIKNGTNILGISQSSQSQNWDKGGFGSLALNSTQVFRANYTKNKITFNNSLEWSLNLSDSPNDTLRSIKIDRDYLKYIGSFNLLAFKKWTYTTTLDMESKVLNMHQPNTQTITTAFLAPLSVNMGILGMTYRFHKDYPKVKGKVFDFDATISPLAVNYKTVANKKVGEKRYFQEEGKSSSLDFGSRISANMNVNFGKNIRLTTNFVYNTSYKYTHIELRNDLNMPINRFFNLRLFIFPIFDDSNKGAKHPKYGYVVTNQSFSVGFNYTW
ncbi:hypothetical protein FACS1894160_2030 [Bacteroidia bacterium]|nr:hypothetical protein FACS1894160_2030 [Bacteroidia bacterium]